MTTEGKIKKGYSDGPFGQIHWRRAGPTPQTISSPDLYCLHPAPFSGLAWSTMMPLLCEHRRVFAPDFPGHGGSSPFTKTPSITDYTTAMAALVEEHSGGDKIDLLGFHTGCLVAVTLAIALPNQTRRVVLIDVPAFDAATREKYLPIMAAPVDLNTDINCLEKAWELAVTKPADSRPINRSIELYAEQLRHTAAMNAAFHAAFTCPVEILFEKLATDCTIIATQSPLLEPSRHAASLIRNAQLIERLDIKRSVLDEAAKKTAAEVLPVLDDKRPRKPEEL